MQAKSPPVMPVSYDQSHCCVRLLPGRAPCSLPKFYSRSPSSAGNFERTHSTSMHIGSVPSGSLGNILGSRRERPLSAQSNPTEAVYAK